MRSEPSLVESTMGISTENFVLAAKVFAQHYAEPKCLSIVLGAHHCPTYAITTCDGQSFILQFRPPGKRLADASSYAMVQEHLGDRVPKMKQLCELKGEKAYIVYELSLLAGNQFQFLHSKPTLKPVVRM